MRKRNTKKALFGLKVHQWEEAREEYRQKFGDEAMYTAHPSAIYEFYVEFDKPRREAAAMKRTARRMKPKPDRNENVRPPCKSSVEIAMMGVNYA